MSGTTHATLRPPQATPGSRRGVRRSRLVFTTGQVRTTAIRGAEADHAYDVVAVVDNPVQLRPAKQRDALSVVDGRRVLDHATADVGTLGLRFADGGSAYLRAADWIPGPATRPAADHLRRTVAHRLGVTLERRGDWDERAPCWEPARSYRHLGKWCTRIGGIVGGLVFIVLLTWGLLAEGVSAADAAAADVARALFVAVPAACLIGAAAAQGIWLLSLLREGRVGSGRELQPQPDGPVSRRFRDRARLQVVHDEIRLVDAMGRELWLGGPDDDFGVARVEEGPGFVVERPEQRSVNLLDRSGNTLVSLDRADWFGTPAARRELDDLCATLGIAVADSSRRTPRPSAGVAVRDSAYRHEEWLSDAGVAGPNAYGTSALATLVAADVGFDALDRPEVLGATHLGWAFWLAIATLAVLPLVGLVRLLVKHLWLSSTVTPTYPVTPT